MRGYTTFYKAREEYRRHLKPSTAINHNSMAGTLGAGVHVKCRVDSKEVVGKNEVAVVWIKGDDVHSERMPAITAQQFRLHSLWTLRLGYIGKYEVNKVGTCYQITEGDKVIEEVDTYAQALRKWGKYLKTLVVIEAVEHKYF